MTKRLSVILVATAGTMTFIVLGLWGWQRSATIAIRVGWENQNIGAWAVRCAALALIALAETILLTLVVERVYRPDFVCARIRLSAIFVMMVCAVSAIALGLAGR